MSTKRAGAAERKPAPPRPGRRAKRRAPQDLALIVDRTEDRQGFHVLRRRSEDSPVELGTIRPLREGQPIEGEVVSLEPNKEAPFLCEVKVEVDARRPTSVGPAQVASEAYRSGWDAIWGGRPGAATAAKLN
jgi:hypothetical protein